MTGGFQRGASPIWQAGGAQSLATEEDIYVRQPLACLIAAYDIIQKNDWERGGDNECDTYALVKALFETIKFVYRKQL